MKTQGDPEEWFDVVDAEDRAVSSAPRSEVHRRRWRHRAVHVLVFNRRGELFLQQRSLAKDDFPGAWDSSSAGHVSAGDDYAPTVFREVAEELGVELEEAPIELFRLDAGEETAWEFCRVYLARHEGPFVLQASEVRGGGWFTAPAVDDWIARRPDDFSSAFRRIWSRFDRGLIPRLPAAVSNP
jgi:16S rRNA (adenine1518-N6/adenine1519-N6)-dimethyltransferase